ncbi:MAG: hypothetical protein ACXWHA_15470 [Usitatibacter sp.]
MKYRIPVFLAGAAATLAGAWMLVRPPEFDDASRPALAPGTAEAAAPRGALAPKLGAASVLTIDPRSSARGASVQPPAPRVTLQGEFLRARSYRALYDRLKNGPEGQTPEGWYVMYEMLRRCATVTDRTPRAPMNRTAAPQKRDDFIASIPANDPARDKRIAAYDDVAANRCAGMESVTIAQADLDKMLANAAAGGDAKAQALSIEQQLWAERCATGGWGRNNTVSLSDAQVASLQSIAGTRDPEAMVIAGRILSGNWNDYTLRVGPDGSPVEQRAFMQAWQLVACDYGYPCDDSNPRLLSACAYQGHCNASSLADFIYYYGASPNDSQLMSQYRDILRTAIESGNWSQVTVARGPRPPAPPHGFGPGG